MPKLYPHRNKAMVQLLKLGWTKYAVSELFQKYGWAKSAVYLVMRRDFNKYVLPTQAELKEITERYHLELAKFNQRLKEKNNKQNQNV